MSYHVMTSKSEAGEDSRKVEKDQRMRMSCRNRKGRDGEEGGEGMRRKTRCLMRNIRVYEPTIWRE